MKRFISRVIQNGDEPRFEYIKPIDENAYVSFKESMDIIHEVDNSVDLFLILGNNYHEIVDFHNGHFRDFFDNFKEPLQVESNEYTHLKIEVNRLILNYLSSFRMLIDHFDRIINKRFGKSSIKYSEFKNLLKTAYDEYFEYRFVYKLRNFCQHCGIPVTDFIIDNEDEFSSIELCFSKSYLLSEYDSWTEIIKEDFKILEEKFSVNEIVAKNFEIMKGISDDVRGIYKDIFITSLKKIDNLTNSIRGQDQIVIVSEVDSTDETFTITIDKFPFDKIDGILKGIC